MTRTNDSLVFLGRLAAGVVHEIKNPLQLIINFADLSQDLLRDVRATASDRPIADVQEDLAVLQDNLAKVHLHAQRASHIVTNVLAWARGDMPTDRTPQDLNRLVEDNVMLAYHALRGQDQSFNAAIEKKLDPRIPLTRVMAEMLGRAILNIADNAFQALRDRHRGQGESFHPRLSMQTLLDADGIQIRFEDNGNGISPENQTKIFAALFTTKPAGVGTGLGLSLALEAVTANGGTITVDSVEGMGTVFTIHLPLEEGL